MFLVSAPAVRVCVPAVQRQRLWRPQEDLHPLAGLCFNCVPLTVSVGPVWFDLHPVVFQVNGKSLSLKQYLEEPSSLSMVSVVSVGASVGGGSPTEQVTDFPATTAGAEVHLSLCQVLSKVVMSDVKEPSLASVFHHVGVTQTQISELCPNGEFW